MGHKSTSFIPSTEPNIQLELIQSYPESDGPYPTLIFNHGSTGGGRPSTFSRSSCPKQVEDYFTQRGWLVLFPQRRGRGKSGGKYAEGIAEGRGGYSCDPEIAMRGFERAVHDVNAVTAHIKTRKDVNFSKIAISGISRGGILAIAYAGMHANDFCGAINFSGGWMGQGCPTYEAINPPIFRMGAAAPFSTLWLYGNKDNYYPIRHCRSNFECFLSAGGKGTFVELAGGHALVSKPALWQTTLDGYMDKIES